MSNLNLPFDNHMRGQLYSMEQIKNFTLAGNATITVRSNATGTRFTYKIQSPRERQKDRPQIWFVRLMNGSDNENSFKYLGNIRANGSFDHGRNSRIKSTAPSARAFNWFWNMIQTNRNDLFDKAAVWHEGRCGRCGRKLTVPESVESGFGPECVKRRK